MGLGLQHINVGEGRGKRRGGENDNSTPSSGVAVYSAEGEN